MSRSCRPAQPVLFILLVMAFCGVGGVWADEPGPDKSADRNEAPPREDTAATAGFARELMEADRLFAAQVAAASPAERGAVWAGWFAPDGRQVVPGAVVTGHQAIAAMMDGAFTSPGFALEWDPDTATASPDGQLGWTSGRYTSRRTGPEGEVTTGGRYVTLWRRLPDGNWKVDLDTGVPDE